MTRRPGRRTILIVAVGCGFVIAVLGVGLVIVVQQGIASFAEFMKPGCGWVKDRASFVAYTDISIPPSASDLRFSGCSYGQALVIAVRFQMPSASPELDEFVAEIGFDRPLSAQFEHHANFSHVYDGMSWWRPTRAPKTVGGHVVRSGKFYDIHIESQTQADIVYVMVELG
jgi:hypothetical protein